MPQTISTTKTKLSQRLKIGLLVTFIFIVTLMVINAHITRGLLIYWFEKQGAQVSIEDLRLNLWQGNLEIDNFISSLPDSDKQPLNIKQLTVDWSWQPLFSNVVQINSFTVQGLQVDIVGDKFQPQTIGPLDLLKLLQSDAPAPEPSPEETSEWQIKLGPIELADINVCYRDLTYQYADLAIPLKDANHTLNNCILWQQLSLNSKLELSHEQSLLFTGDAKITGLKFKDKTNQPNQQWLTMDELTVNGINASEQAVNWISLELSNLQLFEDQQAYIAAGLVQLNIGPLALALPTHQLDIKQMVLAGIAVQYDTAETKLEANIATLSTDFIHASTETADVTQLVIDGIDVKHSQAESQIIAAVKTLALKAIAASKAQLDIKELAVNGTSVKQGSTQDSIQGQDQQPLVDVEQLNSAEISVNLSDLRAHIGQLVVTGTRVWQKASDGLYHPAVQLAQLSIAQSDVSQQQQQLSDIELSQLGLLPDLDKPENEARTPLLKLATLTVDALKAGKAIDIGEVVASGLDGLISYQPQQGLNLANWFFKDKTKPQAKPQKKSEQTPAKVISIKRIALTDHANLTVVDHSMAKPQTHQLSKLNFVAEPLLLAQAGQPSQPMAINLSAQIEQSALLTIKGTVNPASGALGMDLLGKLAQLDTVHYSDYSAQHIGYRIDQGRLNIDFKIKVDNNQINSEFDLLLKKFELAKLQQHEKSPTNKELGVPLPLALNLLRDGDDNIELSIPIKGDLNQPDFSLSSVITVVTFKALKTAVLYHYSPLSVLSLASGLVNLATALRFKSVEFANTVVTLNTDGKAQLDKVGKVLGDKTKVDLVLCANASLLDLLPVVEVSVEVVTEKEPAEKPAAAKSIPKERLATLTGQSRQQLMAIANQRQQAAKAYLVEQHHIAEQRLLLCNVKFDAKPDGKPVVAISL